MIRILAVLVAGAAAFAAHAGIYRCQSPAGTTYQQVPCGDEAVGGLAGIASEYPPVNTAERERLFAREAEMYKRLEALRDRQVQEAAIRAASAPAPQPEAAPPDIVGVPLFVVRRAPLRVHRAPPTRGILLR